MPNHQYRVYITTSITSLVLILLINACNFPTRSKPTQAPAGYIYTAAAQTVQAQLTQVSQPPAADTSPTVTELPPTTPAATSVADRPTPTHPLIKTSTPSDECNIAEFVKDVTIADDTRLPAGEVFEKTWRLKNIGTCEWSAAYAIVFTEDNVLNAPASVQLTTGSVPPGETVDITVTLEAPQSPGTYRQNFKLADETGDQFGMGSDGTKPFWAQIRVGEQSGITYDFLAVAPQAEWKSGVGDTLDTDLAFGGADDNPKGVAKYKEGVQLENGSISGKLLLTRPKQVTDGVIAGFFPEYQVENGDRLIARIGFLADANGECVVARAVFQIAYKEGDTIYSLGEWRKNCDATLMPVNLNLTTLKDKSVQFIFLVKSDGPYEDDWAIWNSPRIER